MNVSSPMVAGFDTSGSLTTLIKRNEAESSSRVLRLTNLPFRASLWELLLSVPGWLHDEHSIITLISFQVNREVRLILTHQSLKATERYLL
jgi:hypothetical protein